MANVYARYQIGLQRLREQLGAGHSRLADVDTLHWRLAENLSRAQEHGDTATRRSERSEVLTCRRWPGRRCCSV